MVKICVALPQIQQAGKILLSSRDQTELSNVSVHVCGAKHPEYEYPLCQGTEQLFSVSM